MVENTGKNPANKKFHLSNQLILNKYMLKLFEVEDFKSLTHDMKDSRLEELDVDNVSRYFKHLTSRLLVKEHLSIDILQRYDENIIRYTFEVSQNRDRLIKWKYFQYLSLLFTEIYLDRYFNQRNQLLADLNDIVISVNKDLPKKDWISLYEEKDLKKIAFWNATGSGKTLIMHINIKQYLYYFHKENRSEELGHIILVTPSEDLSEQHNNEFRLSGMQAGLFDKDSGGLFRDREISIINIHRLDNEMGEKVVAVDSLEGNNLILVDEGHKGTSGIKWMAMRKQLSENGFAFEYSATFGQAVSNKKPFIDEYSKCILFDYSYRYFHEDGYGKEYQILNLTNDLENQARQLYLTACLLAYYQQSKIYLDNKIPYQSFLFEKPLWVFVGGSVNAIRTQQGEKVSDVTEVLLFIAQFINEESESMRNIKTLLRGSPGLLDNSGQEIFGDSFPYLASLKMTVSETYKDIINVLFNSANTKATLRVERLQGRDDELALRLGENDPFGVISVADARPLWSLCKSYPQIVTTERNFSDSYFRKINDKDSSINMLIGSKKFAEGWSSWRVSTMGLMNMGRNEGPLIIQLFGRGVRLKGYEYGLKRSAALKGKIPKIINQEYMPYLETLNIFGIRADYMQKFKEYLEDGGIKTEDKIEEVILPVWNNYKENQLPLKSLRLKEGADFKKQGPKPELIVPTEAIPTSKKMFLNWYPKVQFTASKGESQKAREGKSTNLNNTVFKDYHVSFMNIENIYFEIQRFKQEKSWYNLKLSKKEISNLLSNPSWYILQIPPQELEFTNFKQVKKWEEIAIVLLKKYCEKMYLQAKKTWESPRLEYYELEDDDEMLIKEYQILLDKDEESTLIIELNNLKSAIKNKKLVNLEYGQFKAFTLNQHLYKPLISFVGKSSTIKIKPVALNEHECVFLEDINKYYESNSEFFSDKELYVLRNPSQGSGIGFFEEGGFYPDFIIWLLYNGKQYITFADPKGMRNVSITDSKVEFYRSIKEIEKSVNDPSVVLNSFIISNTLYEDLIDTGYTFEKEEMKERHVLFQYDDRDTYIETMFERIISQI